MKHAYLILAHHEFGLLEKLVNALDDSRNDIFVHIDLKVRDMPKISTNHSNLYFVDQRIDVCWGDVSVVEAEYVLFEAAAKQGNYDYYHLLSGVDIPLKSQDYIHHFFNENNGKEFVGFYQYPMRTELDRKVRRFHLFPKEFRSKTGFINKSKGTIRFLGIKIQELLKWKRNQDINFEKGTQWLSLTEGLVKLILEKKGEVLKIYKNSFCSDEIFVQTICWNSSFRDKVYDLKNEGRSCLREINWQNNKLVDWEVKDFEYLINSTALFARKFSSKDLQIVDKIYNSINS